MRDRECPHCPGVDVEPWSSSVYLWVCPCCSSRFNPGTGEEVHCGSHNDYGTYLCYEEKPRGS